MQQKMQMALLYKPYDFRLEDIDVPTIGDSQALIKIKACGICPSDVRFYTGEKQASAYPLNTGHEFAGVIEAIGANNYGFQVGDRVVTDLRLVCGECYYCQKGIYSYCLDMHSELVRGGYCEYGHAICSSLRKIPDNLSFEEACFAEPLACCVHGINLCHLRPGDHVVVLGIGPIGLLHLQIAKYFGATVVALDLVEERLQKARQIGADHILNVVEQDPLLALRQLTEGRGADAVIVTAGTAEAAQLGIALAGVCGTVNFFAGFHPPTKIAIDPNEIHYKQLTITASHNFTPQTFLKGLELMSLRAVDVQTLISHRFPLSEIQQGFDAVVERKGLKIMIAMD